MLARAAAAGFVDTAWFRHSRLSRRWPSLAGIVRRVHCHSSKNTSSLETMPTKKRIFWSVEEQRSILTTARQPRQNQPSLTLKQIGTAAQRALPKQRRRPVNNQLTSWISSALKSSGLVLARGRRGKGSKGTPHER